MFIPRDYQTEAVASVWEYFRTHPVGNPLVAMPTGTGKSVVIADLLRTIYAAFPNQRVMILTHVKELIQQNYDKLLALWPMAPAGIYSSGLGRRDTVHRIIFAGIASVARRAAEFGRVDLVFVDECHLISPSDETMYNTFFAALRATNPLVKIVGFTATAWRLGVGKIEGAGLFTHTCFDITHLNAFNRLIDEGYLLPLVPKSPKSILDVEGVHMRGGEFIAGELQAAVDKQEVTFAALTEMIQHGQNRHSWLLFCSGVEHAIHTAEMLTYMGVECGAVHSKMSDGDRDKVIRAYRHGDLKAVANNNVLTTGFDHPALDYIGMLRPTASPVLWVQMLGRGTRPMYAPGFDLTNMHDRLRAIANSQKQNCLVMDFANNTKRLGPINDPVIPRKKGEKGGEAPVKLCPCCDTWNHASARVCFNCGTQFVQAVKIVHQASTEALIKSSDNPIIEVFSVDHVTYESYQRHPKPAMMKVTYYCGLRRFNDWVCFDHEGFPKRKAAEWWRARSREPVPQSTHEALCNTGQVKVATDLRIWVNKKPYSEIMAYCYDGSGFGKTAQTNVAPPAEVLNIPSRFPSNPKPVEVDPDADIPFGPASFGAGARARTYSTLDDDIPF